MLVQAGTALGWASQPIWFDRSGKQASPFKNYPSTIGEPSFYEFCDLSPDNNQLLTFRDGAIWMVDLRTGSFVRFAITNDTRGVFSPDGSRVVYSAFFTS